MDVHRAGGRHTFPLAAPGAWRKLRRRDFDIVVEDLNKIPLFSPWWAGAPVVLLVHHLFGRTAFQEAGLLVAGTTWLAEQPLAVMYRGVPVEAVSQSTADDLVRRGFNAARITVIPNGVALDAFTPDPAARFAAPTLLYVGRLKRYKGIDLILQAVARLVAQGVPVRAIIAGKGDYAMELERLRAQLGLQDVVEMTGFVTEAEKLRLLRGTWVHVLTSPKEGWGITNLEAAACGTPTVASDSPGLRDSVLHEETGLLVPHGDVAALATALQRMLTDDVTRKRLGEGAHAFAQRFHWERSAELTEAHLAAVLEGAGEGQHPGDSAWMPRREQPDQPSHRRQ